MISVDTRLNALIRAMDDNQKRALIEVAKEILMAESRTNKTCEGGKLYAEPHAYQ